MTPPPTSAESPPHRDGILSVIRQKAIETYYLVDDFLPRRPNRQAWLRLVRLPNLLTVPGDILAGFLLAPTVRPAVWSQLLLAAPASLLLYAAGLILNDLFDYAEDLRDRPARPLPANQISREAAAAVALVLLWIAAFLAAFFDALPVALPMILCIILYDLGLKRLPVIGPLLMGACRAGNVLLGTAAATGGLFLVPGAWGGALAVGTYVACITHLARTETQPDTAYPPSLIGRLLRLLIPLQALLCVLAIHRFPANLLGLVLLPILKLHRRLAAGFPPS